MRWDMNDRNSPKLSRVCHLWFQFTEWAVKIFDVTLCFQSPARPRVYRCPAAPPQSYSAAGGWWMWTHAGKKRGAENCPVRFLPTRKVRNMKSRQKVKSLQIRCGDANGAVPAAGMACGTRPLHRRKCLCLLGSIFFTKYTYFLITPIWNRTELVIRII